VIEFGGKQKFDQDDPEEAEKWQTGRAQLSKITQLSGGSFHRVETAKMLADELEHALRLDRYFVKTVNLRGGAGHTGPANLHELGSPTRLPKSPESLEFQVLLEQHTIAPAEGRVEGGEALELVYRQPPLNKLDYVRYEPDDMREKRDTGGFFVAAHLPAGRMGAPTFRVSIQNRNEHGFSRRPEIVWAKVTPADEDSPRSYYFVARQFEAGLPAPVLQLPANGWSGSRYAHIELSFAMQRSDLVGESFPIPELVARAFEAFGATLLVESDIVGSDRSQKSELRIVIDEKHGETSEHFPLHLQLDPPPDRATRTYFSADHRARHIFFYSRQQENPKLLVLTRREIESKGTGPVVFENVELPRE